MAGKSRQSSHEPQLWGGGGRGGRTGTHHTDRTVERELGKVEGKEPMEKRPHAQEYAYARKTLSSSKIQMLQSTLVQELMESRCIYISQVNKPTVEKFELWIDSNSR